MHHLRKLGLGSAFILSLLLATGCTPTVKVEVPNKPIEINLNITMKIDANVRHIMEKDLDDAAKANPGIF